MQENAQRTVRSPAHSKMRAAPLGFRRRPIRRSEAWYQCDTMLPRGKPPLPNVLVRDLDPEVIKQLKASARANRRSLQAEIHDVLRRASTRNLAETRRLSRRWLRRLSRSGHSDSAELIRKDRDAR
jgi:plasmid stability protein